MHCDIFGKFIWFVEIPRHHPLSTETQHHPSPVWFSTSSVALRSVWSASTLGLDKKSKDFKAHFVQFFERGWRFMYNLTWNHVALFDFSRDQAEFKLKYSSLVQSICFMLNLRWESHKFSENANMLLRRELKMLHRAASLNGCSFCGVYFFFNEKTIISCTLGLKLNRDELKLHDFFVLLACRRLARDGWGRLVCKDRFTYLNCQSSIHSS